MIKMFLPIPSLDNKYEIDKKGVVRNAKTKHIIKPRNGTSYYILSINNNQIWRCREALMAEVFDSEENYLPVPSLNNKYEISRRGILRNAITKKRLILYKDSSGNSPFYSVRVNGTYTHRYLQQLMWEVHGVLPKVVTFRPAVSVTIQKSGEHFAFDSMTKCAKFLAYKEYYSFSWCNHQLQQHRKEIFGWHIFYRESEKADTSRPSQSIKTRRHKNENN